MSFDTAIQDLADNVAKKAREDATPLAERIDALRALTSYYALFLKKRLHASDDEDETMAGIQERLREIEENPDAGGSKELRTVPTRRSRRADA